MHSLSSIQIIHFWNQWKSLELSKVACFKLRWYVFVNRKRLHLDGQTDVVLCSLYKVLLSRAFPFFQRASFLFFRLLLPMFICKYDFITEDAGHQHTPAFFPALTSHTENLAKCRCAGARGSVVLAAWRREHLPPLCTATQQHPTANYKQSRGPD